MPVPGEKSWLLWLAIVLLSGCSRTKPEEARSPCNSLVEQASRGCREVAARCKTSSACLGALSSLRDPPWYFPSAEPCDKAILARLAAMGPGDIPALLGVIEARNPQAMDALDHALPRVSKETVLALVAHPSWMATAALGAIAEPNLHNSVTHAEERPDARSAFQKRKDRAEAVERVWPAWRMAYLLDLNSHQAPAQEDLSRQLLRLEPTDEWPKVCGQLWPRSEPMPSTLRDHFAFLGASARSPLARSCALAQTFSSERGVELALDGYGGHARNSVPGDLPCRYPESHGATWYFWHQGVHMVNEDLTALKAVPVQVSGGPRNGGRNFRCVESQIHAEGVAVRGGRLVECEGELCFEKDSSRYWVGGTSPIGLIGTPSGDAYAIGAHTSGDDFLHRSLVLWRWDGERQKLEERIGLPGESYRWARVNEQGTLIVATSEGRGPHETRHVTAIERHRAESLRCWSPP